MTEPVTTPVDEDKAQHPIGVFLRGIAMGAADVVPGVSGGTIAFITGIYIRLLDAISAFPRAFLGELLKGRWTMFWQRIDGTFLVALFAGILTSIVTLAGAIKYALEAHPIMLWSFFFGLILASAWHVGREIERWRVRQIMLLVGGAAFAWWVTQLNPGQAPVTSLTLFGAGALAICAMILPGISGSFILLILGMYSPVLTAVNELQLDRLALFVTGCLLGLLSIAQLLSWAFARYRDAMLALLTGFMLGALNKVWPWKEAVTWRTNSHGERVPLEEINLMPGTYANVTGDSATLSTAILLAILGIVIVLGLDWLGRVMREKKVA
ncbi:DUF368 domain-containing protein [Marinobacter nanhaiticus D15-8W]|uniref:DUF368 domain-containing protein n=1 Tax=Marinobacter nanhaiticus D15-8W TaxID=626887 RepID=N6WTV4_9GAMM|nr:DUF368 domain-containing protein [Marinobacter nanhaiticus]ENO14477.1 DUF368 domain-containing protein [Marinobacter nanhaiticus D15-8W]BES71871.1 DUF368 domain-containing protein [Marinobacter nanhaiticus D15-8W]